MTRMTDNALPSTPDASPPTTSPPSPEPIPLAERVTDDQPETIGTDDKTAALAALRALAPDQAQAALALATQDGFRSSDVGSIVVKASAAAVGYPGCDYAGTFERILQAKMSIQYCVAATLVRGAIEEANYRLLSDPEVMRLIRLTTLEEGPEFTSAYPRLQGSEIIVTLHDGNVLRGRLEDVIPATPAEIRARFHSSRNLEAAIDSLEKQDDIRGLVELL